MSFQNQDVELQYYFPDLETPGSESIVATVGKGVEFNSDSSEAFSDNTFDPGYNIDLNANSIIFKTVEAPLDDPLFNSADFNGFIFSDVSEAIPTISSVRIDKTKTSLSIDTSDISFTKDSIAINLEGVSYTPGEQVKLDVKFASTTEKPTDILLSTRDSQVGSLDPLTGVFTPLAEGVNLTDIAALSEDKVFGITFSSLYQIDLDSGQFSLIGNLGGSAFNALGFTTDGDLYAAGGSKFYQVDTMTGEANLVSNLGSDFLSHGDLVFNPDDEIFYATSKGTESDVLYEVSLNGKAVKVGEIGFDEIFGLSFDENGNLFGYTSQGEQISIDEDTGVGTLEQNISGLTGDIGGAANWI